MNGYNPLMNALQRAQSSWADFPDFANWIQTPSSQYPGSFIYTNPNDPSQYAVPTGVNFGGASYNGYGGQGYPHTAARDRPFMSGYTYGAQRNPLQEAIRRLLGGM